MSNGHLTADEFVDLVEGVVTEAATPHLASCDTCRTRLAELRVTLAAAAKADVPEPSPLFWDHLSARVRERLAADAAPRVSWWRRTPVWVRAAAPALGAVAAVVLFTLHGDAPRRDSRSVPPAAIERVEEFTDPDDASLTLVAELTSAAGWDAVVDGGLAPQGSAERAVAHLNGDELRELQRILKEQLQ